MKIAILGCAGRMGRTLLKETLDTEGCTLAGGLEPKGGLHLGTDIGVLAGEGEIGIAVTDDLETLAGAADALIDFTTPAATITAAEACARHKTVHIIGTTGLTAKQQEQLERYAKETPIVFAPNMSVGVNLLAVLAEKVAAALSATDFDIEVLEMHHNQKVDAPSGTALLLGRAAADGRGVALSDVARYTREGNTGARKKGEIGFATLRGGDVIGDHTVMFAGAGERIELTHKASSRAIYARGALRAAKWANGKKPGLYSMKDVLGI